MEVEVVSELAFERDEELEEDDDEEAGKKQTTSTPPPAKLYTWRTDQRLTVGGAQHFNEEVSKRHTFSLMFLLTFSISRPAKPT